LKNGRPRGRLPDGNRCPQGMRGSNQRKISWREIPENGRDPILHSVAWGKKEKGAKKVVKELKTRKKEEEIAGFQKNQFSTQFPRDLGEKRIKKRVEAVHGKKKHGKMPARGQSGGQKDSVHWELGHAGKRASGLKKRGEPKTKGTSTEKGKNPREGGKTPEQGRPGKKLLF